MAAIVTRLNIVPSILVACVPTRSPLCTSILYMYCNQSSWLAVRATASIFIPALIYVTTWPWDLSEIWLVEVTHTRLSLGNLCKFIIAIVTLGLKITTLTWLICADKVRWCLLRRWGVKYTTKYFPDFYNGMAILSNTWKYPLPQATPGFYLAAVEKNREKAWGHCYATGWKWWTRLVCNVDSVCTCTNQVHHFRSVM